VKQTAAVSNSKPVEILFKPKPEYTDEARAKKIEGEVLLQVIFAASGEVKVERVVQGLGYGLDHSAEAAAREIRFRPAQQEGQPVDANAIVHITFALAY
jgi:TonB family protein